MSENHIAQRAEGLTWGGYIKLLWPILATVIGASFWLGVQLEGVEAKEARVYRISTQLLDPIVAKQTIMSDRLHGLEANIRADAKIMQLTEQRLGAIQRELDELKTMLKRNLDGRHGP